MRSCKFNLPEPLQRKVLGLYTAGIAFFILFAVILLWYGDLSFSAPCMILSLFLLISGSRLFYHSIKGDYVCMKGTCTGIEQAGLRGRNLLIRLEEGEMLRVRVGRRRKTPSAADRVILYLAEDTPVYEWNGAHLVCSYYAIEVEKKQAPID